MTTKYEIDFDEISKLNQNIINIYTFLIYKELSQQQKENPIQFKDKYQFEFREYELFENVIKKVDAMDYSYKIDLSSAMNSLKNSSIKHINEIFANTNLDIIDNKTLLKTLDFLSNIPYDNKRVYDIINLPSNSKHKALTPNLYSIQLTNIIDSLLEKLSLKDISLYEPFCYDNKIGNMIEKNYPKELKEIYLSYTNPQTYPELVFQALLNNIDLNKLHYQTINDQPLYPDMKCNLMLSQADSTKSRKELTLQKEYPFQVTADGKILLDMIEHSSSDGIILAYQLKQFAFNNYDKPLREYLTQKNLIDAIIELPPNILDNTRINIMLFILKNNKDDDKILFIDATSFYHKKRIKNIMTEENLDKLSNIIINREEIKHTSKLITNKKVKENDYKLNVNDYIYTYKREINDKQEIINDIQENNKEIEKLENEIIERISQL